MSFYIFVSIFFYYAFYSCCANIIHSETHSMKVNDIADGLLAILNQNKNESKRVKELKEKLTRVNSYEVDKNRFYALLSNVTRHSHFNKTNFYEALQDRDHKQLSNESKPIYVKLKEKMNRDDVLSILAVRGRTATKMSARRMLLKDNLKKRNKKEIALNNAIGKFLQESSKDEHHYTEDEDMYKFWDPAEELRVRKALMNPDGRRLFKGEMTFINFYPFMVSVHLQNRFWCGGVLYWVDMVITSAACLQLLHNNHMFRENPNVLAVMVGSNFTQLGAGGEKIPALEIFFHPSYNPRSLDSNIAMIRLRRAVSLSYHRVPKIIDITHVTEAPPSNSEIMLLGWGVKTGGHHNYLPMYLQMKIVPVYPYTFCQDIYGKKYVNRNMFCGGTVSTGEGACAHDAGGPAILNGKLVGIISFGPASCGLIDAPTVFTNVGVFSDWIETINETISILAPKKHLVRMQTTTTRRVRTWSGFTTKYTTKTHNKHPEITTPDQDVADIDPFKVDDTITTGITTLAQLDAFKVEDTTGNLTQSENISSYQDNTNATEQQENISSYQDNTNATEQQVSTNQEDYLSTSSPLTSPMEPLDFITPITAPIGLVRIRPQLYPHRALELAKRTKLLAMTRLNRMPSDVPSSNKLHVTKSKHSAITIAENDYSQDQTPLLLDQTKTTKRPPSDNSFVQKLQNSLLAFFSGNENGNDQAPRDRTEKISTIKVVIQDQEPTTAERSSEPLLQEAVNHIGKLMAEPLHRLLKHSKVTEARKSQIIDYESEDEISAVDDKIQVSGITTATPIYNSEKENYGETMNQLTNVDIDEYLEATMHEKDADYKKLKEELGNTLQKESIAAELKRELDQLNGASPLPQETELPKKQEEITEETQTPYIFRTDEKRMLSDLLQWANKTDLNLLNKLLNQNIKQMQPDPVYTGNEVDIEGTDSYIQTTRDNMHLLQTKQQSNFEYEQFPGQTKKIPAVEAGSTKMPLVQQFQEQSNSMQLPVRDAGTMAQRNPEVPWGFMDMHPVQQGNLQLENFMPRLQSAVLTEIPQQIDWPDYSQLSQSKNIERIIEPAVYDQLPPDVAATAFTEDAEVRSRNLIANGLQINANL